MDRAADDKVSVRQLSGSLDGDTRFAQVHTVRSGGERDIDAIVDQHLRGRSSGEGNRTLDKARQPAVVESAFTDLHDVYAAGDRAVDLGEQRWFPRALATELRNEPAAISDETESQRRAPREVPGVRRGHRTDLPAPRARPAG